MPVRLRAAGLGRRARLAAIAWAALPAVALITASARPAGDGAPRAAGGQAASGTISTLAGGPGGPEDASNVAVAPCGVSYGEDGHLYISEPGPKPGVVNTVVPGYRAGPDASTPSSSSGAVQQMSPGSGQLDPFAGTYALRGPVGDRGPAGRATLSTCGTAEDQYGNLLIADHQTCRIRVVAATSGTFYRQAMTAGDIYTIAGHGACTYFGNGSAALRAGLDPVAVQADAPGNLVILDHNRIRVVAESTGTHYGMPMTTGRIYTIAGTGKPGFSGDGGPAIAAGMKPAGLALDTAGDLVLADTGNCRVRVVAAASGTFYGQPMTAGDIYTVAGDGTCTSSGDAGPATSAGLTPEGVAVDAAGNLVIADVNNRVRVVAAASGTFYGQPMTAGDIYTVAGTGAAGFSGDGGPATSASLNGPEGVAIAGGNVVVADTLNNRVRVIAGSTGSYFGISMSAGDIYTIAGNGNAGFSGDGGPAAAAEFHDPGSLAVSGDGNLAVTDFWDNRIRLIPPASGTFYGQPMTAGSVYTIAGNGNDGGPWDDGGPATGAPLNDPAQVTMDAAGNLVIADTESCWVQVVAGSSGTFYGTAMQAGDIYGVAGDGHKSRDCVFSGSGGAATATGVRPVGVAVDAAGNLVIADSWNCRVLVVADSSGTFYGTAMRAGHIYSVAGTGTCGYSGDGGPAAGAELNPSPGHVITSFGIAIDAAGNIVIPDSASQRVRVVAAASGMFYGQAMTAGDIYTVAGTGAAGFAGDGGPAASAELSDPTIVAIDGSGNLMIADSGNDRVRVLAAASGTFYGQAMTAGDIYTVAGTGTAGFAGDGGPAASAELSGPEGLAVGGPGDLLIADGEGNNRIREVAG